MNIQYLDQTLDQLIRNAEAIEHIDIAELSELERDAFEKVQESLLQRLLGADAALSKNPKQQRFKRLESKYSQRLKQAGNTRHVRAKRHGKRSLVRHYADISVRG